MVPGSPRPSLQRFQDLTASQQSSVLVPWLCGSRSSPKLQATPGVRSQAWMFGVRLTLKISALREGTEMTR